jgi:hypothetical protein
MEDDHRAVEVPVPARTLGTTSNSPAMAIGTVARTPTQGWPVDGSWSSGVTELTLTDRLLGSLIAVLSLID